MKCKQCRYNDKKSIGRALKHSSKGLSIDVKLNKNGVLYIIHKSICLSRKHETPK